MREDIKLKKKKSNQNELLVLIVDVLGEPSVVMALMVLMIVMVVIGVLVVAGVES